jgi:hypothetical protein
MSLTASIQKGFMDADSAGNGLHHENTSPIS